MLEITGDIYLLGDIHGSFKALFSILDRTGIRDATVICVGDVGAGYPKCESNWLKEKSAQLAKRNIMFYAIRGNHDDPSYFNNTKFGDNITLLRDYTYANVNGESWLFIGGALSVDRTRDDNIPGRTYWVQEEVVFQPELIKEVDVLITHTGPSWVGPTAYNNFVQYWDERENKELWPQLQQERKKMNKIYALAQPKKAFLGHFHETSVGRNDGCRARILNIDEVIQYNK